MYAWQPPNTINRAAPLGQLEQFLYLLVVMSLVSLGFHEKGRLFGNVGEMNQSVNEFSQAHGG